MNWIRTTACSALASLALASPQAKADPAPAHPALIVVISVDQYSSELFKRYRPSYVAGLKTLSDGVVFPTGYQSHAATETCPGHSTLMTGLHPASTGIVANSWFDVKTGSSIYCVAAPDSSDPNARGPQNMHATTLGDWMKTAQPGSRSFAVSGKDRAAITMGGKHADGVWWWFDGVGFTTSPFAGPADAKVTRPADEFNAALAKRWSAAPPALWGQPSADCARLEQPHHFGQIDLSGKVPPDGIAEIEQNPLFPQSTDFQNNLRASPLFDSLTLDFAEQLIAREKLGHGPATDVLSVSLSANDYVGHRYGNGGAEMCVQQASLDASLGTFIADLKGLGVPVMVVLTADHGATDAAEREHEHDDAAHRFDGVPFVAKLNKMLMAQYPIGFEPIVGDDPQQLYINFLPDPTLRPKIMSAAVAWLKQQPEVSAVFTRDEVAAATVAPGTTPDKLTLAQRFHESYDPDRSGDIAVAYAPRTSFGMPRSRGDVVAGHGSVWDHDRQVPILFWWTGATPETRDTPIETVDIAPTLAALAGIPTPKVDGHCVELGGGICGR